MFSRRISHVNGLHMNTLVFCSTVQIGDSTFIDATNYTLAVQREQELFISNEGGFNDPVFTEDIHVQPLHEKLDFHICHANPFIHVGLIDLGGASASSMVHIGSSRNVRMQAKIKNIRHLYEERPSKSSR
ncbi:spore germination protein PE [Peribacillus deserti]|uniref:Spore germination protein PE n=1 Tax=Peribacillus deserti TaxID=673318 RepID=A0ABS2QMN2_9BACI|nr:spore germination protein GerPE [Peribacillus deserti]MBM7694004.1 spore germination protein PE [Peribacillus deserti]